MPPSGPPAFDPESRLKEPLFRGFLIVLIVVMALGVAGSLYNRTYEQLPTLPVTVGVFVAVVYALRRWGYEAASTPFVYALAGLFLWAIWLQGYNNEQNFLWTGSIALVLMLVGGLFFNHYRDMMILSITLWVFYAIHVARAFLEQAVTTKMLTFDQQLIAPTLLMLVGMLLMLLVRRVFSRIVAEYRQLSDERLRGQESLGQLVRGLSHHLNTPLGNARLLLSMPHPDSQGALPLETVRVLERSNDASIRLVQRLADFMRLSENPPRALSDGAGLKSLVLLQAERPVSWRSTKAFDQELATPRPHYWESMALVVRELVANAWIHGGSEPSIDADVVKGALVLVVENEGARIPAELRSRVRDPFFSSLVTADHPGLGLYFADYLTTFVLRGRLSLDEGRASGTRVTVILPLS